MTVQTKIEMPWGEKVPVKVKFSEKVGGYSIDSVSSSYGEKECEWKGWLTKSQTEDILKDIAKL